VPSASLLYTSNRVIENFITFVFPDPVPFKTLARVVSWCMPVGPFASHSQSFYFQIFYQWRRKEISARCKHVMQTAASCGLESDFQIVRSRGNVICHIIVKTALVKG
jgi:hypothetical protein